MPKIVHLSFPDGTACPNCGREVTLYYNTPTYKSAMCDKGKGYCGWWGYWTEDKHREQ